MVYLRKLRTLFGLQKVGRQIMFSKARTSWFLVWKPNPERKTINQMWQLFTEDLQAKKE